MRQGRRRRAARRAASRSTRSRLLPGGDEPGQGAGRRPAHPHDRLHRLVRRRALRSSSARPRSPDGQCHIKKVVAEMGGKNVVIVDSDADLDDVVPALLSVAFAFAGQKCSAASRVARARRVADELAERLAGAIAHAAGRPGRGLRAPTSRRSSTSPRSSACAATRATAPRRPRRSRGRRSARGDGFYVAPTIFAGLPDEHPVDPGGDLRPGAVAGDRRRASRHACERSTRRASRSPAACSRARRARSSTSPSARRSATSTSTARSPARWSAASRSAAGGCPAPARRPAGPTTCCSSSRRARSREHRPPRPRRLSAAGRVPGDQSRTRSPPASRRRATRCRGRGDRRADRRHRRPEISAGRERA